MGTWSVEQAQGRLQDILQRARHLRVPTRDVLSTKPARKLLARTKNSVIWGIFLGTFLLLLSGIAYTRWPITHQEIETVRTVLMKTCRPPGASREFSERVAALMYTSSTQDDC